MKTYLLGIFLAITSFSLNAQYSKTDSTFKPCFIGSSMFMLGNFLPEDRPDFFQLNFGYRPTEKDVLAMEIKTWKYHFSLGIPYGEDFEHEAYRFPGYIREFGFAVVYQRFLWKGLYTGVHVMNAWQHFINNEGDRMDKGFQIFNTYRLGYHVKLWKNRFFLEPSIAITHRAFHTEMPESFKVLDEGRSKFFFGEPGLHFGFNF